MAQHTGTCTGGTGPQLGLYPGLTYAPAQHGDGIRFAHNGAKVEAVLELKGSIVLAEIEERCVAIGVPFGDYLDGLRYARAEGLI